jgi:hypothetical protein
MVGDGNYGLIRLMPSANFNTVETSIFLLNAGGLKQTA